MDIQEIREICNRLISGRKIDFLDISLWDCFKEPEDDQYKGRTLLAHFTSMDFKDVRLTVAGKIRSGDDVCKILDAGVDFVSIGTSAILHHNFPKLVTEKPDFTPTALPVSREYLTTEGLGERFINYMSGWPDFVAN